MLTNYNDKITRKDNPSNKIMVSYNMESNYAIRIEIKNKKPIELVDLTNSFFNIADEYKRYTESKFGELKKEDVTLYIQDIKSGSIIADLFSITPAILPILSNSQDAANIIQFASYLKNVYDFLLGRNNNRPNFTKVNYLNFAGFVEPIAKDNASQLNIHTIHNEKVELIFNLSSIDANAAQNSVKRELGLLAEPSTGIHRNVVFYWYQARNDASSQAGDKVIIESIYPFPVKAIFDSELVKSKVVWCNENPLTSGYLVDVSVETIQGKPVLYKILDIHSRIAYPPQTHIKI